MQTTAEPVLEQQQTAERDSAPYNERQTTGVTKVTAPAPVENPQTKENPTSRVARSGKPPEAAASEAKASATPPMFVTQEDDLQNPTDADAWDCDKI